MVEKRLDCKWSRFRMRSGIGKLNHLKSGQMATILSNHLKSGLKLSDFEWSGFWTVGTIAIAIAKAWLFEIRPSKSVSVFQMVRFQIPTVSNLLNRAWNGKSRKNTFSVCFVCKALDFKTIKIDKTTLALSKHFSFHFFSLLQALWSVSICAASVLIFNQKFTKENSMQWPLFTGTASW